jgi:Tfp pilus assembly protein PilN
VLQAHGLGSPVITFGDVQEIGEPAAAGELLAGMISQKGFRSEEVISILPRRVAILKQILLPSHSQDEVRRMAALQIGAQTPYLKEEIVFDARILVRNADGYSRVLLSVVPQETVIRHLKILERAGLRPQRMVLSSFGLLEWWKVRMGKSVQSVMLINVDGDFAEICFLSEGHLVFSRSLVQGADWNQQIRLTLEAYQNNKMGIPVERIVLVADGKEKEKSTAQLQGISSIPVEVCNSLERTVVAHGLELSSWEKSGLSLASSVGCLWGEVERHPDFIPLPIQAREKFRRQKKVWLTTVLTAAVLILFSVGGASLLLSRDARHLKEVEARVRETQGQAEKAKRKMDSIDFLRRKSAGTILIAEVMKELYRLSPSGVFFDSLSLDAQGTLTIEGLAISAGGVNTFQNQLVNSSLFKAVNLEFATKRQRLQDEYTDFKIVCQLRAGEDKHE